MSSKLHQARDLAIELKNISKAYKLYRSKQDRLKESLHPLKKKYHQTFYALKDISLELPKGQTYGLIGLNGSGKSTLLKIVCGVTQPSSGELRVHGHISALLELGAGFNPEFTGEENVFFSATLLGMSKKEIQALYPEIVNFANIGEFISQPVKNYSSGMLVRLAFAVAIHVNPEILIIDEALAVGDVRFQHKCMAKIESFKGKATIVFVTHNINDALTFCDQLIWLHKGQIKENGNPAQVANHYLEAMYEEQSPPKEKEPARPVASQGSRAQGKTDISAGQPNIIAESNLEDQDILEEYGFGSKQAQIKRVWLCAPHQGSEAIFPGQTLELHCQIQAREKIHSPIVGFLVKNHMGLEIFGFNNLHLGKELPPLAVKEEITVCFQFQWPEIVPGSYSFSVAIAQGTLEEHTQLHWLHNVLNVESLQEKKFSGLVNLQPRNLTIWPAGSKKGT